MVGNTLNSHNVGLVHVILYPSLPLGYNNVGLFHTNSMSKLTKLAFIVGPSK